jgi:hypothetical protein
MMLLAVGAFAAAPLAAQHQHPAPAAPRPAAPAAAAPAAHQMGMAGGAGRMMPGMDSMMGMCPMMGMGGTGAGSMMTGMDSLMGPLHAVMAYAPRQLLARRAELRLDEDQVSRLAGIPASGNPEHDSTLAAITRRRDALRQALAALDPATVTAHFAALHAAMGAMHGSMLRSALEARAVLTPGQRSLVEGAVHNHGGGM